MLQPMGSSIKHHPLKLVFENPCRSSVFWHVSNSNSIKQTVKSGHR